jgi:HEAT repeat protein
LKRKLPIALFVIVAVLAGLVLWQQQAEHRTRYQGKSIREWAVELNRTYEPRGTNAATIAFRAMSSNAVPALRSLVKTREPFYEKAFLKHARKIPTKPRNFLFQKLQPGRTAEIRLGALRALGIIGPAARDSLPEMLAALADPDSRLRWTSAQTIAQLGPEAITALIPLTTNADVNLRHAAVYSLGEARTNALPATIPLLRNTLDTNESVCASAYYSLSRIGRAALPQVIATADTNADPALRNAALRSLIVLTPPPGRVLSSHLQVSTNSAEMRRLAILSLSRSRLTNSHALNIFTNALADDAPEVRAAAELALKRIRTGVMVERPTPPATNASPR